MPDILRVALTGGIASGKSVAAEIFENLGCYIYRSDEAAHKLMQPHSAAWEKIVAHFGEKILNPDQTIHRGRLGDIIFKNDSERIYLNRIVHPLIMQQKKKKFAELKKEGRFKIFISEAALTIESGYAGFYHKIVVVYCPDRIQLRRLMQRDHISTREARQKINSQMPLEEKKQCADYVIDSSGPLAATVEQTEKVFRYLHRDHELLQEKNLSV
jgi:dephospho-CoA kinase